MYLIQKINNEVLRGVRAAFGKGYVPEVSELAAPPDPKWGDIAFPCFGIAKGLGRPPAELAAEAAPKITPGGFIKKAEARGPYVNFFIDIDKAFSELLAEIKKEGARYGSWTSGRKQRIVVEYAQPNTHKAVHVGHVRNMVIGRTIARLFKALGWEAHPITYHGDIGTHVATTLWGLQKFHGNDKPPSDGLGAWLGEIYAEAVAALEKDPEAKAEIEELNRKLEQGDRTIMSVWKETRKWSIREFKRIFKELGVVAEKMYFESEMEEPGRKIVAGLLRRGIAESSRGATVVNLDEYNLPVFMVLKSDGTTLYSTRDLALAVIKEKIWKPHRSLVVVDARQGTHFAQLAKTLEISGIARPPEAVLHEFVKLPEGAISSRKGAIITYDQFRDALMERAAGETRKRHEDWSDEKIIASAEKIVFSALNFGMLSVDTERVTVFDLKRALSFEGYSGPYIQYTGARISGILKKAGRSASSAAHAPVSTMPERRLVWMLAQFPLVVFRSGQKLKPHFLAEYLFEFSKSFSEFYEQIPVLAAEPKLRALRLDLISAVRRVLVNGAELLGFEIPEEM